MRRTRLNPAKRAGRFANYPGNLRNYRGNFGKLAGNFCAVRGWPGNFPSAGASELGKLPKFPGKSGSAPGAGRKFPKVRRGCAGEISEIAGEISAPSEEISAPTRAGWEISPAIFGAGKGGRESWVSAVRADARPTKLAARDLVAKELRAALLNLISLKPVKRIFLAP